ncbi:hypothetical protein [Microbulbifer taiwanensis]|uniref:hypothetical protein n=1 Tax=Microbulbifer taiwanensis TaxID=986746 RepID=UPI00360E89CE
MSNDSKDSDLTEVRPENETSQAFLNASKRNANDKGPADTRPDYVTSRLRYFDGEFLSTQDFIDEQNYHVDRQVRHEANLHAPGVLEGLDVTQAGDTSVSISPGSALDASGNQVLLSDEDGNGTPIEGYTVELPENASDGDYIVDLLFIETATDPQSGSEGDTRFTQDPKAVNGQGETMLAIGASLREGAVPLARVRVAGGVIDAIDTDSFSTGVRTQKYAGLRLPGKSGDAGTLRFENINENPEGYYPGDAGYPEADYRITLDQKLFLKQPSTGEETNIEIEKGALIFLDSPGDIWAHDYGQRILLQNNGVELLAKDKITLTTNNTGDPQSGSDDQESAIHALVAHASGNVGIGIGDDEPAARLEIKGDGESAALQVTASDGSALLTAGDGGADISVLVNAQGGISVSNTQIDTGGQLAIGKSSGAPSNPWKSTTKTTISYWQFQEVTDFKSTARQLCRIY